ncbi:Indoleamine 2,3-dioxygenase [Conoideocrella luteorostrata]|uniref:Indoleamine 2,3-dioxygenase n=1 Tax=Conoideocrella luteorostrata TaxID=1105319 RepID=A0AAJ0CWZ5_9HYPO|nr:Indoleamine 2,3-dioxygenase [Conoideocrella luteorostrata]
MAAQVVNLGKFGLSKTLGFLSDERPLRSFSNPYFTPWDDINVELPELIASHAIYDKVQQLPLLSSSELSTELEFRRAYVVLAFTIHGYIWSGSKDGQPLDQVPPQLAEPFLAVCESIGLRPVLSYAGLCLWNWSTCNRADESVQAGFPDLPQMQSISSFTGTRGEDAFYHVPVLNEAEGGPLVSLLLNAVAAPKAADAPFVTHALHDAADAFVRMGTHLPKLHSVLDADMFYHILRPFFSAGSGMEDKGLPRGVVFQMRDGSQHNVKYVGGSAGQSALFQFLDMVLGVEHQKPDNAKESFFEEMRAHMPGQHRDFLLLVSKLPPLREFVDANMQDAALVDAFDSCVKQLRLWRGKHIAIVSKYIVRPARQAAGNKASSSTEQEMEDGRIRTGEEEELKGTAGSALIPFLRQTRDETAWVSRRS